MKIYLFRFAPTGPLQLININLEFYQGEFIGIVGQSGSGKSTLNETAASPLQC